VCAITATWWLNRQLTFAHRRSQSWAAELLRYALGQAAGLGVNLGVFTVALWLLTPLRELPIVALALGSATALLFNFVTARTFAFRGRG
jgi:putative flippase GtrA